MSWRAKVERVIGKLSAQAYRATNTSPSGSKYKRHHPYRIPEEAQELVACLGDRDQVRGERTCKTIMEGLRRRRADID